MQRRLLMGPSKQYGFPSIGLADGRKVLGIAVLLHVDPEQPAGPHWCGACCLSTPARLCVVRWTLLVLAFGMLVGVRPSV